MAPKYTRVAMATLASIAGFGCAPTSSPDGNREAANGSPVNASSSSVDEFIRLGAENRQSMSRLAAMKQTSRTLPSQHLAQAITIAESVLTRLDRQLEIASQNPTRFGYGTFARLRGERASLEADVNRLRTLYRYENERELRNSI